MENPWLALGERPPYLLPCDAAALPAARAAARGIHLDVLPVPHIGSPSRAELYLLALNPGYRDGDVLVNERYPAWVTQQRRGLAFQASPAFWTLHPRFAGAGIRGYDWWTSRLGPLAAVLGWEFVRERVMCIQYLAYRSTRYAGGALLPSQRFSFQLVREAVTRGKAIVIMRARRRWLEAVPELTRYPYYELRNPQAVYVSAGNMQPGAFDQLTATLRARADDLPARDARGQRPPQPRSAEGSGP